MIWGLAGVPNRIAGLIVAFDRGAERRCMLRQGSELDDHGNEFGDNQALWRQSASIAAHCPSLHAGCDRSTGRGRRPISAPHSSRSERGRDGAS
jgi:hypothetical protein